MISRASVNSEVHEICIFQQSQQLYEGITHYLSSGFLFNQNPLLIKVFI